MEKSIMLRVFNRLAKNDMLTWIPDELYLKTMFMFRLGYPLNLRKPKTFNEKIQWLKLYDRKPEYAQMVDKYDAKLFVSDRIGDRYIIPTIGVWDCVDDINFDYLPNQFVLKCTHDSGSIIICPDKGKLDKNAAKKVLSKGLSRNMFDWGREWPYKNLKRRIIAENYLRDESGYDLKDYKVLCFNGEPKLIELHQNRYTANQSQDYYDTDWKKTGITQNGTQVFKATNQPVDKPKTLQEMLELSRILSKGIPLLRVDWYSIRDQLYFGELTFYDGSGFEPYDSYDDDLLLGSWIELPLQ